MKKLTTLLFLVFTFSTVTQADNTIYRKDIVLSEQADITKKEVAWPKIVKRSDGKVQVFYSTSAAHYAHNNLSTIRSIKSVNDEGWFYDEDVEVYSVKCYSVGVAGAYIDSEDNISLSILQNRYEKTTSPNDCEYRQPEPYSSTVFPRTYTERKIISFPEKDDFRKVRVSADFVYFPHGNGIKLETGDILFPMYWGVGGAILSSDDGLNWNKTMRIFKPDTEYTTTETNVTDLGNGRLIATVRAKKLLPVETDYHLFQSKSYNNGESWTAKQYLGRGGPAYITKLNNNHLLLCYTYRSSAIAGNVDGGIYCMISVDSGKSWGKARKIYQNNAYWDFGYVQTVELNDGHILAVYYANVGPDSTRIQIAKFQESAILGLDSNLVKNPHMVSWAANWNSNPSQTFSTNHAVANNWTVVPSGGEVKFEKRNAVTNPNDLSMRPAPYRNNDYIYMEVTERNDYIGVKQTVSNVFSRLTDGSSMEFNFIAYSKENSKIYVSISSVSNTGQLNTLYTAPFNLNNNWKKYAGRFDLPDNLNINNHDKLQITFGFKNSAHRFEQLGLDAVLLQQRQ